MQAGSKRETPENQNGSTKLEGADPQRNKLSTQTRHVPRRHTETATLGTSHEAVPPWPEGQPTLQTTAYEAAVADTRARNANSQTRNPTRAAEEFQREGHCLTERRTFRFTAAGGDMDVSTCVQKTTHQPELRPAGQALRFPLYQLRGQ